LDVQSAPEMGYVTMPVYSCPQLHTSVDGSFIIFSAEHGPGIRNQSLHSCKLLMAQFLRPARYLNKICITLVLGVCVRVWVTTNNIHLAAESVECVTLHWSFITLVTLGWAKNKSVRTSLACVCEIYFNTAKNIYLVNH
jgi:hypothetical protein